MNAEEKLLTRLKAAQNIGSGYALAKVLGVATQTIYNITNGRNGLSDPMLIKIAHLIDENPIKTVCEYHLQVEKNDDMRQFYSDMLEAYFIAQSRAVTDEEMREAG
jgi:plasmid maintenance system antidote protein VapI